MREIVSFLYTLLAFKDIDIAIWVKSALSKTREEEKQEKRRTEIKKRIIVVL